MQQMREKKRVIVCTEFSPLKKKKKVNSQLKLIQKRCGSVLHSFKTFYENESFLKIP